MLRRFLFFVLLLALSGSAFGQSLSLTVAQCKQLSSLVRTDADAAQQFARIRRSADAALDEHPDPIKTIQSEGKLPGDPARIKTSQSMKDMAKLAALGYAFADTGKAEYAAKAREFILAWAKTNRSAGDPIDDTGLESLLIADDLTGREFSSADRQAVETYLRQIADEELKTAKSRHHSHYNNWNSHRVKIVGLIAFLLHDQALIKQTVADYKEQIDHNLRSDGSSIDFHQRDALHYHIYDLEPLVSLAVAARNNGIDLYSYRSPEGGSLSKGIAFLLPFAAGTKTHAEFVHSTVSFDRKRAEAGDKHYEAGRTFEPKSALGLLEAVELFDPQVHPVIVKLAGSEKRMYYSWTSVLNAARR